MAPSPLNTHPKVAMPRKKHVVPKNMCSELLFVAILRKPWYLGRPDQDLVALSDSFKVSHDHLHTTTGLFLLISRADFVFSSRNHFWVKLWQWLCTSCQIILAQVFILTSIFWSRTRDRPATVSSTHSGLSNHSCMTHVHRRSYFSSFDAVQSGCLYIGFLW